MTEISNTGLIWEYRLALLLPRPLFFGAFIFIVCFSTAYIGFQWLFGFRIDPLAIGYGLMIANGLIVPRHFAPSTLDHAENGQESAHSDRNKSEIQALHLPLDKISQSRIAGVVGVLVFFMMIEVILIVNGNSLLSPWVHLHDNSVSMFLLLLMGWFFGRLTYFSLIAATSLQPIPQKSDIDLLNLENLYAIGRRGLPNALIWLLGISIGLLMFPVSWGQALWPTIPVFVISLAVGLTVLLIPARGVRDVIKTLKKEELVRLKPMLRQARDDTLTDDVSMQGRLTDLLAYQERIKSTSEWPFDLPTMFRLVLYAVLPVLSMVAGALVERLVNFVLD